MKLTIIFAGLLGIFLTPALADVSIQVGSDTNSAVNGQQSVSVNKDNNVANVDNNSGWNSWNTLLDYGTGFVATRIFSKKACIVHRMNKNYMPSLQALDVLVKEKKLQGKGPGGPPPKGLIYSVNPDIVNDLHQYGKSISVMCKGIPTYLAEETVGASLAFNTEKCLSADILWILNISLCGIVEN